MSGFDVDPEGLTQAADAFRVGAENVEVVDAAFSPPAVGAATGPVASALAQLVESAAGIVEGLRVLADETDASAQAYVDADDVAGRNLRVVADGITR